MATKRCNSEVVWQFHTRNLNVRLRITPEEMDPAACFCEQDDIDAVRSGAVHWFVAEVTVEFRDGTELGNDSLGGCAYRTIEGFYTAHRDPDPLNRNSSVMRAIRGERTIVSHYFPDMIRTAMSEARKRLAELQRIPLRRCVA